MVGSRIKYYRELKQLNGHWLADKIGVDVSMVNRIENDKSDITINRLYEIALALEVSLIDLIEEKYLHFTNPAVFEKYGAIESGYIRFIIVQHELLRKEKDQLLKMNTELMNNIIMQQNQIRELISHLKDQKNTGGVKNK